jgi:hypothetical protein
MSTIPQIPITPPPREAVPVPREADSLCHRRAFGDPIPNKTTPGRIGIIAVKDPKLQRPVPTADGAKFDSNSSLLFRDSSSPTLFSTADSTTESSTFYTNPNLVSNFPVSAFGNNAVTTPATHTSPMMDGSVSEGTINGPATSLNLVSGTASYHHPSNSYTDSDLAMKLFDNVEEDMSFLFTPHTTETSFATSALSSAFDTPTMDLAQLDQYLNSTSLGDFSLFGDTLVPSTDEWTSTPLFAPGALADDPIAPYAFFNKNTATVTSASPQQFSLSTVDIKPDPLPSPELSPAQPRKTAVPRGRPTKSPAAPRRVSTTSSTTPFTPITPAPTTPSTPIVFSRATKRRLPVIDEDPAVVEKRRRNTIAAQRSRARKAEEKMEDKARIEALEKEAENLRVLISYWKDRACELGASPLEDGENYEE